MLKFLSNKKSRGLTTILSDARKIIAELRMESKENMLESETLANEAEKLTLISDAKYDAGVVAVVIANRMSDQLYVSPSEIAKHSKAIAVPHE